MKVTHITTSIGGGAGISCLRFHKALRSKGIESNILTLDNANPEQNIFKFNYWDNTTTRTETLRKGIKQFFFERESRRLKATVPYPGSHFTFPQSLYDITTHPLYLEADIVQLNWVSEFLDEPSFFNKNTKPLIWKMDDLYICGGGNHTETGFSYDLCKEYYDKNYSLRKELLKDTKIQIIAPSKWACQKAKNSELIANKDIHLIPNGIDTTIFKPYDKKTAREIFGIPLNQTVLLAGSESLNRTGKGFHMLLESIEKEIAINNKDIRLYTFGADAINSEYIKSIGTIKDEKLLAILYSAADIFIMPSVEETFGQVTVESLACGTPVVSLPNGGSIDIIKNGVNGILADDFTSESLSKAITKALEIKFDRNTIREDIVNRFDINNKADEYIKLYEKILVEQ